MLKCGAARMNGRPVGCQIALQEMVEAVRIEGAGGAARSGDRGVRSDWSLAPVVRALQALRGVDLIVAVTFATEIGDVRRFESPRQLMGYLGLVPSERSTGETVRRGGDHQGRQRPGAPHAGRERLDLPTSAEGRQGEALRLEQTSPKVREIAWKAQTRLTARYRALSATGQEDTVVCTAIARELVGFMWPVAREAQPA